MSDFNSKEIEKYIHNSKLRIRVKLGTQKTEIVGWDDKLKVLKVHIHAKAEDNKANIEIIKLFSKLLKKKIALIGLKSRDKICS